MAIALSKTPSRAQTLSWVSRMPSRWTLMVRRLCGGTTPKTLVSSSSALVNREMWRGRAMVPAVAGGPPPPDRPPRRAAVVGSLQAGRERQPVLELAGVPLDGAADAGEVAGVEGLQHQHVRVTTVAGQRVADLVPGHVGGDVPAESHRTAPSTAAVRTGTASG